MDSMTGLIAYLLSSIGLTVLVVWPKDGPGAWFRENVLRRLFSSSAMVEVLDCYICSGFWIGLFLSPFWWFALREPWYWSGCLMISGLFWLILQPAD